MFIITNERSPDPKQIPILLRLRQFTSSVKKSALQHRLITV